jgi:hypothetical protein
MFLTFVALIIMIIIIIILVITFMQGIYNYIPETNHVSRVYSVAFVLYLQSVLHVMLFTVCATCNVIYSLRYM